MTLPRLRAVRRIPALVLMASATFGLSAVPAHAAGETLSLVQDDPAAVAGRATNFTASGTLNPDDTMFGFDIYVFLKDPDKDPTCAPDFDSESATAMHSGGNESWISPATGFQVGAGPTFDQPFKITFTGHGDYLLCGYVQGDFSTFATGQLRGVVAPDPTLPAPPVVTPTPTPGIPAAVRAPWITRKGHVLTCHPGAWSNSPTSVRYRWYARTKPLSSGRRLHVRRSMAGRTVACRVTAGNAAGTGTASSRAIRVR